MKIECLRCFTKVDVDLPYDGRECVECPECGNTCNISIWWEHTTPEYCGICGNTYPKCDCATTGRR